jgi:uncharacterized membrane protein
MPDQIGSIIAAVIIAIAILGAIGVANYQLQASGTETSYTETFDAGASGTLVTFNESDQPGSYYSETVNVTTSSDQPATAGLDYEWIEANGTLRVLDGDLDNTTDNTITYDVRRPTSQQSTTAELVATLVNSGTALPLVLIVGLVVLGIGTLSNL